MDYTGSITYLEHVVLRITVHVPNNSRRGYLNIELESPSGTLAVLLHPRIYDNTPGYYEDRPFMSVMFWGENPLGQWTVKITMPSVPEHAYLTTLTCSFMGYMKYLI